MKRISLLAGLMVFQLLFVICPAQNISRSTSTADTIPFRLKQHEWNKMQKVWSRKYPPVKVLLSDGDSLEGQILRHHNDTVVLYLESLSFINQYVAGNSIMHLHRDSIVNILHDPESKNRSGLLWGIAAGSAVGVGLFFAGGGYAPPVLVIAPALIGSGIGASKDSRKNRSMTEPQFIDLNSEKARKKYLLFPYHLPGLSDTSEHEAIITPEIFAPANFDDLIKASPLLGRLFGTPAISLSGYVGRTSIEKNHRNFGLNLGFTFTYNTLNRLKIGYLYKDLTTIGKPLFEHQDFGTGLYFNEDIWIVSHTLFVKYVPFAVSPYLTKHFEASAGIGVSFNKLYHSSRISHNEWWELLASEHSTTRNTGLAFMSDFDLYIFRHFSFYLSINKSINKPFKPKDLSAVNPLTGATIVHKTMEVYPSPLDFMVGLRLHLLRR